LLLARKLLNAQKILQKRLLVMEKFQGSSDFLIWHQKPIHARSPLSGQALVLAIQVFSYGCREKLEQAPSFFLLLLTYTLQPTP